MIRRPLADRSLGMVVVCGVARCFGRARPVLKPLFIRTMTSNTSEKVSRVTAYLVYSLIWCEGVVGNRANSIFLS